MGLNLPERLASSAHAARLEAALHAVRGAGAALLAVRGERFASSDDGDQLKTSVDRASEGWVLGYLRASLPDDVFLSEEEFESTGATWSPRPRFWTVDALDGTRSFVENFDGFCVQVGLVEEGAPVLGVVHEPVAKVTFVAARGAGAYAVDGVGAWRAITLGAAPERPTFVDSIRPQGAIGAVMDRRGAAFLECGSFGLKLCRVAEARADVFAKAHRFKLWDVAPAHALVVEAGGRVGLLTGAPIPYGTKQTHFSGLLAARKELFDGVAAEIASASDTPAEGGP